MNYSIAMFATLALSAGLVTNASAAAVISITVTGGIFRLSNPITPGCVQRNTPDTENAGGCIPFAVGTQNTIEAGFTGGTRAGIAPQQPDNIVNFNFFSFSSVPQRANVDFFSDTTVTSEFNSTPRFAKDWSNGFQGDVTPLGQSHAVGQLVEMNLGGWHFNWNEINLFQGTDSTGNPGPRGDVHSFIPGDDAIVPRTSTVASGVVTSVIDATTVHFSVSWYSYFDTGPFNGQVGHWELSGIATTVPVPEAETYVMMLAGLGLVGVAVRHRRKIKSA